MSSYKETSESRYLFCKSDGNSIRSWSRHTFCRRNVWDYSHKARSWSGGCKRAMGSVTVRELWKLPKMRVLVVGELWDYAHKERSDIYINVMDCWEC